MAPGCYCRCISIACSPGAFELDPCRGWMRLGTCTPPSPLTGGKATPYPADRLVVVEGISASGIAAAACPPSTACRVEKEPITPPIDWKLEDLPFFEHSGKLIVGSWPQNSNCPHPSKPSASRTGGCWLIRAGRGTAAPRIQPIHQPARRFPEVTRQESAG